MLAEEFKKEKRLTGNPDAIVKKSGSLLEYRK